jgi:hypothetical protein
LTLFRQSLEKYETSGFCFCLLEADWHMQPLRGYAGMKDVPESQKFALFGSVRNKLLVLMIALSLLPLAGMSVFSYVAGRKQIQDRIRLSLGKMAQDTADKIDLMLRGKKEEIHAMAITYPLISRGLDRKNRTFHAAIEYLPNYEAVTH